MKYYWLYLESYSFIFEGVQGHIIYNTLNGKTVRDNLNFDIYVIIEQLKLPSNGYCVILTEEQFSNINILSFVSEIRSTFSGDIIETHYSKNKPFIIKPLLDLLNDPEKIEKEKGYTMREDILSYLHEINIYVKTSCDQSCVYCEKYYKQCVFCTTNCDESILEITDYKILFDHLNTIGLQKINIIGGNLLKSKIFNELILMLDSYSFMVNVYINYGNVNEALISLLENHENISIILLSDAEVTDKQILEILNYACSLNVKWQFVVSSDEDYFQVNEFVDKYNLSANIVPFFNGMNNDFFSQNVYLDIEDILSDPISKQQIFIRQVINENLFGKLTIMPDGEVYANVNKDSLGNLKAILLPELVYNEIAKKETWLMRRDKKPCSDCVYKLLCPSPGNYELVMNKLNLCHVNDL